MTAACPSDDDLAAYLLGKLPRADLDRVADHVDGCPVCEARVEAIDGRADSVLVALRGAVTVPTASTPPPAARIPTRPAPQPSGVRGRVLGPYRLGGVLGRGGMGSVYRATHAELGRLVAVKVLPPGSNPAAALRFRREVRALGRVAGRHVVQALDAGHADGLSFLVMELIDGTDLGRVSRQLGPLHPADACELARQAALGLHAAHEHGLVHRDVKPNNLILGRGPADPAGEPPVVKVLDLGLAICAGGCGDGDDQATAAETLLGTRDYMPPEQWDDSHAVDARSDVYALGCTLYHLLAGRPPYGGARFDSLPRKMRAHQSEPLPDLPGLPAGLGEVLRKMSAKSPADRYLTAGDAAAALAPFAAGADLDDLLRRVGPAPVADDTPTAVPPTAGRRRWRWGGAAATAAVFLGGTVFGLVVANRPGVKLLALLRDADAPVRVLAFGPDGRWAVSGNATGDLRVWDLVTGRERSKLRIPGGPGPVTGAAVSPDGRFLAATAAGRVHAYDAGTGAWVADLGPAAMDGPVAFAPDGRVLYASSRAAGPGGPPGSGVVRRWSVGPWAEVEPPLTGADDAPLQELAVSPDGSRVAAGYDLRGVWVWDARHPSSPAKYTVNAPAHFDVTGLHFSPDGGRLVVVGGPTVAVVDLAAGRVDRTFHLDHPARDSSLRPDGRSLVVAHDHGVGSVSLDDGAAEALVPSAADARAVVVAPDGGSLLVAQGGHVQHRALRPSPNPPVTP